MKNVAVVACLIGLAVPGLASAQYSARSARHQNHQDSQDVEARMGRTLAAVTAAEAKGRIAPAKANSIRNMIDRMRADYSSNKRQQGFASAGELASYNRSLDKVDAQIDAR